MDLRKPYSRPFLINSVITCYGPPWSFVKFKLLAELETLTASLDFISCIMRLTHEKRPPLNLYEIHTQRIRTTVKIYPIRDTHESTSQWRATGVYPGCQRVFFPLAWSVRYRATSRGKKPSGHGGWEPHFHDLELWTQSLIGFRGQCQSFPSDNDLTPIFTGWTPIVLQKPVFSSRSKEQ